MKAINIIWDTDGEDIALPSEIDIPDGMEDEDEISDYITDVTGFCHMGFDLKGEAQMRIPTNDRVTELRYIDLLDGLYEDVITDRIPESDKEAIVQCINALQYMLQKYSE